jgi:DNA processing protein
MQSQDTLLLLALVRAGFLRPRDRVRLAGKLASAQDFAELSRGDIELLLGRPLHSRDVAPCELLEGARRDLRSLTANGIGCIFLGDPRYPKSLAAIFDPPLALFYRGRPLVEGERPAVAVVGTRRPSAEAREAAREVGSTLARAGVTVVSGLARGIDCEAHRGAVGEGGGHVAVLGCGLERILPASNAALGRRLLASGGTLLSELPPDEPPRKQHFPARNRIINGLSRLVLVVQAPARSGALITADFALSEGREVLVHSAGLAGERGEGGAALAESGARSVASGGELLRVLGIEPPEAPVEDESIGVGKRIARALERELGLGW